MVNPSVPKYIDLSQLAITRTAQSNRHGVTRDLVAQDGDGDSVVLHFSKPEADGSAMMNEGTLTVSYARSASKKTTPARELGTEEAEQLKTALGDAELGTGVEERTVSYITDELGKASVDLDSYAIFGLRPRDH